MRVYALLNHNVLVSGIVWFLGVVPVVTNAVEYFLRIKVMICILMVSYLEFLPVRWS